jgi:hypothetical protein
MQARQLQANILEAEEVPSCYIRSTPSYKILSEYTLILTQGLTSYPLVLVGLSCCCSSFTRVTNELPTSRTVVALRRKGD